MDFILAFPCISESPKIVHRFGSRMLQEASTKLQEWLKQAWPQDKIPLYTAVILTCGSTASYLVLKWLGQKRIKKQIEETRRQRDRGLIEMEKSVQAFKSQVHVS